MQINLNISDTKWAILKTQILDPEALIRNYLSEKIRKCTNRVYEETTEKVAKKKTESEKITELGLYELVPRSVEDNVPNLKHEIKKS